MELDNLNILVTGGGGYLGSRLVIKLLNKGYNVRVLDSFLFGEESLKSINNPRLEIIKGDIRHIEDLFKSLKGIDAVIHLAAVVGDPACEKDNIHGIEVNIEATKALIELCKYMKIKRFIFASTCSVYGASDDILNETSKVEPLGLYALSKLHCEEIILKRIKEEDQLVPVILRMSTLHGLSERMRFDLVLNIMTARALKENKLVINGGDQWRPLVHVDDASEAFILALEAKTDIVRRQIFNIGDNSQNFQIKDVGKEILKVFPEIKVEYSPVDDPRNYKVSCDKINKVLGFKARKTVQDGILEIKKALEEGKIKNYQEDKYYNVRYYSRKELTPI